jgi:hypothetical protein
MITLEDLKDLSEFGIKGHLMVQYTAGPDVLDKLKVLVAYESVGDWGCDSSSYFLLKDKETNELFEVHGSHCSCFGFENQFELEPTTLEALKFRIQNGNGNSVFFTGGYDRDRKENMRIVNEYIQNL